MGRTEWTIGGAIEHGSFMMALAAVLLTAVAVLLAVSGLIAYIRVRWSARSIATEEARKTAEAIAEKAANDYLQAELPAIVSAYAAFSKGAVADVAADQIAGSQE